MTNPVEVVFCDLFFTLVTPGYNDLRNENDVLGVSRAEWEKYAEDAELYLRRAAGAEKSPHKIIEAILEKMNLEVHESEKAEILKLREERFRNCLIHVEPSILEVLSALKSNGRRLCLISNSDVIDVMHWDKSPLNCLFEHAIFSHQVGFLKPQLEIYEIAFKKMKANPEKCIFIGDGGSDELKAARKLGIKTVLTTHLFKRGSNEHEAIAEFADYCIENFAELKRIIQ